jgi:uncharacterized protein (TIGR03437 family)
MKALAWQLIVVGIALSLTASGAEIRTGWWRGRYVTYKVVNGKAVRQGDMVLGRVEEIATSPPIPAPIKGTKDATFAGFPEYLWPNGIVPYVIASTVPAKLRQQIASAIQVYTDNTPIRWIPRTNETNYIRFKDEPASANECGSSFVGMQGGAQEIDLNVDTSVCDTRTAIHEMGHAIGFEHEQTRANRDYYVHVRYENIDKNAWGEYDQNIGEQIDLLPYEYGSIMHYGAFDFQRNDFNTIDTIPPGIPISQKSSISEGDLEAVRTMYGQPSTATTVATNPPGLQMVVDGATVTTPRTFNWAPGTTHSVNVASAPQSPVTGTRYAYARWSNDGPQSQTLVAGPATRILTANFATQYRVQATAGSGGGGTVSISPASADGFYTLGTLLTITATPNAGFTFLGWDGAGSTSILTADSANPAVFTVNSPDLHYIANFTRAVITTLSSNIPAVTATIGGQTAYLPSGFAWTPGTTHTIAIKDAIQPAGTTGLPYRYVFQNWSNGGAANQTITAGAASSTITATWKRQFLVSPQVFYPDPAGSNGGTITISPRSPDCGNPGPDDCYYDEGATVQATAVPRGAYAFAGWSGDVSGTAATTQFQVNDQKVITASFQIPGRLNPAGITNGANYVVGEVAPGELITLFGLKFGPGPLTTYQVNGGVFANTLAQTRVLFDGAPAPLIYVSDNVISAIVPYAVAGKTRTTIQVEYQGRAGNAVTFPVTTAAPALLTLDSSGRGQASIINQNGSVNSMKNPAPRGSVVLLYGTGEGATSPGGVDGKIASAILPKPVLPVRVTIGGRDVDVQYAGAAPGNVAGLFQINAVIPADCPTGAVPISVTIGNVTSPEIATVAVQ